MNLRKNPNTLRAVIMQLIHSSPNGLSAGMVAMKLPNEDQDCISVTLSNLVGHDYLKKSEIKYPCECCGTERDTYQLTLLGREWLCSLTEKERTAL